MSLIVTSNDFRENRNPNTNEVAKAYSYRNNLLNTLRIPKNSQIAFQSAKITRNQQVTLDKGNAQFNHYFGVPVGTALAPTIKHTTQTPFPASIGARNILTNERILKNVDDMVDPITLGINSSSFNPALIQITPTVPASAVVPNSTNVEVNRILNVFEGYKYTTTQNKLNTKYTKANLTWTDISGSEVAPFTQAAGTATSTTVNGMLIQNREYPISQNKGTATITFGGMNATDNDDDWACGLSRISTLKKDGALEWYAPTEWADTDYNLAMNPYGSIFGDIVISRLDGKLKVFQSGVREDATNESSSIAVLEMNEIVYYGGDWNAQFKGDADGYDIKANDDDYVAVKFTLDGEHMRIDLIDDSATEVLLTDYIVTKSKGGLKANLTAPICASKMAMYPMATCEGTAKTCTIEEIFAYTNYPKYDATVGNAVYDWWGYCETNNLERWALEVENRFWNNVNNTTGGILNDGCLLPVLITADVQTDYQSLIITAPSDTYGQFVTAGAVTSDTLGFRETPVSIPTSNTAGVTITNSNSGVISNTDSIFIRLNDFNQNSINAVKGTNSKIIAHLPRFDNGGNEFGSLYYEPNERVYLKLNNVDELLINSFDIDIVYQDEQLCKSISAKSVICLHIK